MNRHGTDPAALPYPDPRTFCRDRFPWPFIVDLTDGEDVTACYVVHEKQRRETKANKPFLRLLLGDRTGTVEAMVWEDAEHWDGLCAPEAVVGVRARVGTYQDKLQLKVQLVQPLRLTDDDLELFLPASPRPRAAMLRELDERIDSVGDPALRALLDCCMGAERATGRSFRTHPAAKRNHHAYIGGLMEHSLSVAAICDRLVEHYARFGTALDRDLLITGALLHDIGKIHELSGSAGFGYTTPGRLLGHIVIGIGMVERAAEEIEGLSEQRLLLVQHLIASHQGKPEWDSPKVPQMLEAMLLHYADDLDSKMNAAAALLNGIPAGEWSAYDRNLARSFFQSPPLPGGGALEPVEPEKAAEMLMDLFPR